MSQLKQSDTPESMSVKASQTGPTGPTNSLWLLVGLSLLLALPSLAEDTVVPAGNNTLQLAVNAASAGDILSLSAGRYTGTLVIGTSVSIVGQPGSIVDAQGRGDVIRVNAADVSIQGLSIINSGDSLDTEDSGIYVTDQGDRVLIENNHFEGNLVGVFLKGPDAAIVRNNTIIGSQFHRMNDRGNGVYLWNSPGTIVEGNHIRYGRDGIFVATSKNNIFRNNRLYDLRFAIHYMYTQDSEISGNISRGNHSAWALMFSDRLIVTGNRSEGDRDRAMFLNTVNYSTISDNQVSGGAEKCVFIYNANMNTFSGNRFEGCDIGIHFTAGSEKNKIFGNSFIANRTQVKYVGTRHIEWSFEGKGNYWSDNPAFDLNNDGISDQPYRPNGMVDQLVWKYPTAKLLLGSPVMQILRWVQSEFPAIHPGGVRDSVPLMTPPEQENK
ncbi:MAG: nitrous oxide reductase family maturation protein NosD [Xanthomonadales bacterium]|nr:nitrous oxide reductase family maturation protein NosD [Xanthomonadales bacterium]